MNLFEKSVNDILMFENFGFSGKNGIDDFIDDSTGDKIFSRDKQKLILRQRSHSDRVIWVNSVDEIFE